MHVYFAILNMSELKKSKSVHAAVGVEGGGGRGSCNLQTKIFGGKWCHTNSPGLNLVFQLIYVAQ